MTVLTPPSTQHDNDTSAASSTSLRTILGRISRLEIAVGAAIAVLMLVLVIIEPNILEAPFENARTLLFTAGGTVLAGAGLLIMLWLRVPPAVRVILLVVPFAIVNWWLLSPYFIDDVVDEEFTTSISAQLGNDTAAPAVASPAPVADAGVSGQENAPAEAADTTADAEPAEVAEEAEAEEAAPAESAPAEVAEAEAPPAPTGPVLLGAGQFVGLAGHDGTGDAGIFQNPDGSLVLRFENFDIENGPDLEVYLVPGADQTSLPDGSIALGELKGNIGDQNYELPPGTELASGEWTVLVWCEAFSVEFVGATVSV